MIKRILPIYQTGWFYLLLLFWGFSYWYVSIGGLNPLNQLNIHWLSQLQQSPTLSGENQGLKTTDVLTLQSGFNERDVTSVTTLLTYHPNSQVTLLGHQSDAFITKLEQYLSLTPRNNKIVIDSGQITSAPPLKSQATMTFSPLLNWFRFPSKANAEILRSKYFIFTPLLQNERQSFPLVWHQQGKMHLSLPGEILKQLSSNTELLIKQDWQLSLISQGNTSIPKKSSLGFFGEVFISENLPTVHQLIQESQINQLNRDKSASNLSRLSSVSQFIQQYSSASQINSNDDYKVIIITDNQYAHDKIITPLLSKLLQHDYVSQSILVLLLAWVLLLLGIILTWFIRHLPIKQQLISVFSFTLVIFTLQYFLFNQQQWLEVLPVVITIMGTWLLLFAYQKEYRHFVVALNYQGPLNRANTSRPNNASSNKKEQLAQVQTSTSLLQEKSITASHDHKSSVSQLSPQSVDESEDELEQTLVILDSPVKNRVQNKVQSQANISHHLTVGNFGRYQVEGILGKGAMGIVYQGVDPKINRHVAIKTLQLSDDIDSPEFGEAKERFFREAQTAGGLSHANIVTIYDVGEDNHLGYIAMDLLTGAPLSLFTQPGQTLPTPLVYQLLIQITDALDYAHKQNVVHRDIKPANIIYDDDLLKVTVTDFGIAYVSDNSKTRTGIIMGSPYYMSPEQILGLKVDGRSDIFSLGVTFYQLLCGHLPFEGESIATVAYQITKAKAIAVNQHNKSLPTSAMRICNKAMHKDIEKRYQTMAEFKFALTSALKRDFKVTTD
ncbi:hypothetical protein CXF85_03585 [Colwellia sp. 75C3]|uniref:serine/threonine-protein kinase n=1 Tax=Colwellia sp. 75C3 TaxID=888425 RepID=UPI000C341CA8|nr:serine/threonine-protein kinase [Colwellia sp. 75C3]PKG85868.1 hypothetical protein CXF85_03585 [Colwellia sp. 75C3]